jgi:hypothetical protein
VSIGDSNEFLQIETDNVSSKITMDSVDSFKVEAQGKSNIVVTGSDFSYSGTVDGNYEINDEVFSGTGTMTSTGHTVVNSVASSAVTAVVVSEPSAGLNEYGQKPITVLVNGKLINFDRQPMIVNDRTMVPVRFIAEELGYAVDWNADKQFVTITNSGSNIVLSVDCITAYVDGKSVALDAVPFIQVDRTMVPLRFIAEGFGATVDWNDETRTVMITK